MGVSQKHEIEHAVRVLKESGCPEIVLLHCVSEYPANPRGFLLCKTCPSLKRTTVLNLDYPIIPWAMWWQSQPLLWVHGLLKNISLDRNESSIDGEFSMLPDEFQQMVNAVHMTHDSISGNQLPQTSAVFKRSILISSPVCEGDRLTPKNIRIARPGDGLCPSRWFEIVNTVTPLEICRLDILSQRPILFQTNSIEKEVFGGAFA